MMYKELLITSSLMFFLLAVSIASAADIGTWAGYARTDGSIAANGTIVSALADNSTEVKTTIGTGSEYGGLAPAGYYSISIEGGSGNTINFKICGIYATPAQGWSSGPHYNGTTPNFNLSVSKSANGASCTYSCGCSGGYCCSGATQYTNGEGTGTCQASACTAPSGGTTGTTGGVGGGVTVVEVTKTVAVITSTSPATVTIESDKAKDLKVDQITVEVKETVINIQVTVKESSLPSGAASPITSSVGSTYKYIDVSSTVESAKLDKVKIKFKVERTWITANNISESTIALQRYDNNQWIKLTTIKLPTDDSTYIYFEAESPGLSVFAITGEKKVAAVTPACTENWSCGDWGKCANNKQVRTCVDANNCGTTVNKPTEEQGCVPKGIITLPPISKSNWFLYVIIIVAALASIILFLGMIRKKIRKKRLINYSISK